MLPDDTRVPVDATADATPEGGIYVIRLSDTHYYGGRTKNFRVRWTAHQRELREGRHDNRRMQRVYDRYGRFDPEVVSVLAPDECPDAEQAWLDANFRKPGCVNLVASSRGGMAGVGRTPESRAKQSATLKSSPDLIDKARASIARNRVFRTKESYRIGSLKTAAKNRGRKQTPEQIARRVESVTGRKNTPETIERMRDSGRRRAAAMPTSHGDETRTLISTQQRGRVWVNDGTVNRRLWPDEAATLVVGGWVYGKVGGSVAGMVWMVDPTGQRRRVRPQDVSARLEAGYTHTPTPKSSYVPVVDPQRGHRDSVWVRRRVGDGWECRRVDDAGPYLMDGWERGARPRSEPSPPLRRLCGAVGCQCRPVTPRWGNGGTGGDREGPPRDVDATEDHHPLQRRL